VRILAIAVVSVCLLAPIPAAAQEARPNILVIVTDDQPPTGTFGVMPDLGTWLIRGGTRYTRAFAPTPLCCPSRASLFSGRYAHNHGVKENGQPPSVFDQSRTIQRSLHDAGYRTAIFGKYLNNWQKTLSQPPPHFDVWAIFARGLPGGYYGGTWNVGGNLRTISTYSTDYISNRAARFIRNREAAEDQPWFLYLAPFAPHWLPIPEPSYEHAAVPPWRRTPAMRETNRSDKPPYVRARSVSVPYARSVRASQLRTLMSVDDMVGRVMRLLRELGERNTLVMFVSDNGYMLGEHSLLGKTTPYTASIRIPLLVRWPGHVPAGARVRRLVSIVDIAPTIAQAAGSVPDWAMDGRSLLGTTPRAALLTEFWRVPDATTPRWASIRTTRYQYVEYYGSAGFRPVVREYYNLVRDPWQLVNLLGNGRSGDDPNTTRAEALVDAARSCAGQNCP
jgi:arylsulfatase A-like enzyme